MIPGKPRDDAVGILDLQADAVGTKIVEQRPVRDRDAVGEAGRAARILKIGDVVSARGRKLRRGRLDGRERLPFARRYARLPGSRRAEFRKLGRIEEQLGIAALELHAELVDVGLAATEARRQRKRDRPGTGIK